jgi:hypothetical protein
VKHPYAVALGKSSNYLVEIYFDDILVESMIVIQEAPYTTPGSVLHVDGNVIKFSIIGIF